jgi:hypothetical protein
VNFGAVVTRHAAAMLAALLAAWRGGLRHGAQRQGQAQRDGGEKPVGLHVHAMMPLRLRGQ